MFEATAYRGEKVEVPFDLDGANADYPLDGSEVVRVSAQGDSTQLLELPITVDDAEAGIGTYELDLSESGALPIGVYDQQLIRPDGPTVLASGTLVIRSMIR